MPIKINWTNAKFLGIALFFLGIMGMVQAFIFIPIGQYTLRVGSWYVLTLVPIGITLAMTYAAQILYEAYLQVRSTRSSKYRKKNKMNFLDLEPNMIKSALIIVVSFAVSFGIAYGVSSGSLAVINTFIVSENIGAITSLVIASVMEKQLNPQINY